MQLPKTPLYVAGVTFLTLALASCATGGSQTSSRSAPPSVFEYHADYPAFDSVDQLAAAADVVVAVEFTGEVRTYELEPIAPEDPTDPEQNPELGAPEQSGDAPYTPPIVVTAYTATVVGATKGTVEVGDLIEVKQLGGQSDGQTFAAPDETSLADTDAALVFLTGDGSEPYSLLSPNEGQYPQTSSGTYVPLEANEAPITEDEVEQYLESE